MITEVHCQSTKMLTNDVCNVRLATDMYVHTVDKEMCVCMCVAGLCVGAFYAKKAD